MKLGQLIDCNLRNNLPEKSYRKCGRETLPMPFSKKSKLSISLDLYSKSFTQFIFNICQVEDYQNILKLS